MKLKLFLLGLSLLFPVTMLGQQTYFLNTLSSPIFNPSIITQFYGPTNSSSGGRFTNTDMVDEFPFNEGSGTIAFNDKGSINGTLVNSPAWTPGGVLPGSLTFNGLNYILLTNSVSHINALPSSAFSCWLAGTSMNGIIYAHIDIGGIDSGTGFIIYADSGTGFVSALMQKNSGNDFALYNIPLSLINDGVKHQIAVNFTNFQTPVGIGWFVDGTNVDTSANHFVGGDLTAGTAWASTNNIFIGGFLGLSGGEVGSTNFNGTMDVPQIYSNILTVAWAGTNFTQGPK